MSNALKYKQFLSFMKQYEKENKRKIINKYGYRPVFNKDN